jgi:hypothetical protein
MVLALEQLNDAAELVELLAPPVDPIFADPEVPA